MFLMDCTLSLYRYAWYTCSNRDLSDVRIGEIGAGSVCFSWTVRCLSIGMRGGRGGGGGGRGKNIGFISKLLFSCAALYILCSPHFSKLRCAFRQKLWRDLRYLVRHRHLELELYRPVDLQYTVQAVLAINIVGSSYHRRYQYVKLAKRTLTCRLFCAFVCDCTRLLMHDCNYL